MFRDREAGARSPARELALDCLAAGIEAAQPTRAVEHSCSLEGDVLRVDGDAYDLGNYDRVLVIGAGKAADGLAAALESLLGDRVDSGVVVTDAAGAPEDVAKETDDGAGATDDGPAGPSRVDVLAGDHPVPGDGSREAGRRVLDLATEADEGTLVLGAITGGGSALLTAPADGIDFGDLRDTTDALVRSGASIAEINAVRKHASAVKGGRLAQALAPATVVGLLLSDVVGDDPGVVASGPTAPDASTFADALGILDRYDVDGGSVRECVAAGERGEREETPAERAPAFDRVRNYVLAGARTAVDAASETATERGYAACVISTRIAGEAREVGPVHGAIASEALERGDPVQPPAVLLSAGECTVTVRGDGRGGPNQAFALAAALDLPSGAVLASVDTDGADGPTDAAGALVDADTIDDRCGALAALDADDVYPYLDDRDALLMTGATGTNVNDLRVVVLT